MRRGKVVVVNRRVVGSRRKDFYVGRPSKLGNPFKSPDRAANVRMYRTWLKRAYQNREDIRDIIDEMTALVRSGETIWLACWCAPRLCHADAIKDLIYSLL